MLVLVNSQGFNEGRDLCRNCSKLISLFDSTLHAATFLRADFPLLTCFKLAFNFDMMSTTLVALYGLFEMRTVLPLSLRLMRLSNASW
jgi:hypothetical protein